MYAHNSIYSRPFSMSNNGVPRLVSLTLLFSIVLPLASPSSLSSISKDHQHITSRSQAQAALPPQDPLAESHPLQVPSTKPPDAQEFPSYYEPLLNPPPAQPHAISHPLLPAHLEPEVGHFDVLYGIHPRDALAKETRPHATQHDLPAVNTITHWQAVGNSTQSDGAVFKFSTAGCKVLQGGKPRRPLAISFDGKRCSGYLQGALPASWCSKPDSAFTVVWIGRFSSRTASNGNQQVMLTLRNNIRRTSRDSAADATNHELFWGRESAFTYSKELGYGFQINSTDLGRKPENVWTMEVLVRHDGATAASYHRYTVSYFAIRSRYFRSRPTSISFEDTFTIGMDSRTKGQHLQGDLAVLLLYNRALNEADITQLAKHYAVRFKWNRPDATPSPPELKTGSASVDFLGCYKDMAYRALPQLLAELDHMTVQTCKQNANDYGYPYYGLEAGRQCFAGWDLGRALSHGPSMHCTRQCAGSDLQICGGDWAISLYGTGIQPVELPPTSISPSHYHSEYQQPTNDLWPPSMPGGAAGM